jgi:hypothetical protein
VVDLSFEREELLYSPILARLETFDFEPSREAEAQRDDSGRQRTTTVKNHAVISGTDANCRDAIIAVKES